MKKGEAEIVGVGLAYSVIADVISFTNEFFAVTGYLFGLLFYFILVYIGIRHYKMNDKSIYISLMAIVMFNVITYFLAIWFLVDDLTEKSIAFFSLFIAPVMGYILILFYIKIVRYFTEEIKEINN